MAREKWSRRPTLSTEVSFSVAAAIAFLAFAANTAASPLYRVYQAQFGFSATTLTLLFTVYIVVSLATLLFLGSASDYVGRRLVMLSGLAVGAVACALFLIAHALALLFAARALQGVAVGLISGQRARRCSTCGHTAASRRSFPAGRRLADRPSARSGPARWPSTRQRRLTWSGGCCLGRSLSASSLCLRCGSLGPCAPAS